jgi:lipopolysaccharide export LptBFGC system permease protein LptF
MLKARNFLLGIATIISLSVAYYFLFALPAHNRKILQLEREKLEAVQKAKEEEDEAAQKATEERKIMEEKRQAEKQSKEFNAFIKEVETKDRERNSRIEAEEREANLEYCLQAAEERYWDYIKLNGTLVPYKEDTYRARQHIWDNARKDKKEAFDECYRRWGHRSESQ